jgi:hypothetical protein
MKTKEEIEQLAESQYGNEIGSIRGSNPYDLEADRKNGYIKGYTQCQQDMADKKYTFNQITDAMAMAREINGKETYYKYSMEEIINSLNKQD